MLIFEREATMKSGIRNVLATLYIALAGLLFAVLAMNRAIGQELPRITILYDAFGKASALKKGWGYAALVEYAGKRILFDTGGDLEVFAFNSKLLGVDLTRLDFVVITHRHGDHTSGLQHVLKLNPQVQVYTPAEPAHFGGGVASGLTKLIKRRVESAPEDMHYYDGQYPDPILIGSPWPGAKLTPISTPTEVQPNFWLFSTYADVRGARELNEISMAIRTPEGMVLMVGCSHPGIERILSEATKIDSRINAMYGGLHLVDLQDAEVSSMIVRLRDQWKLERVGAGHCTGEFAFSELARVFGARFDRAGVGSVISVSSRNSEASSSP